jgi:hypothetical protein
VEFSIHCKCPGECDGLKFDHTHRGTHHEFLKELVEMRNGQVWEYVCKTFFQGIIEAEPEFFSNLYEAERGLAAVFLCDWGIHRSVAALYLILLCCYRDQWRVKEEWVMLSRNFRSRQKCPWIECNQCHRAFYECTGEVYQRAMDIFEHQYNNFF